MTSVINASKQQKIRYMLYGVVHVYHQSGILIRCGISIDQLLSRFGDLVTYVIDRGKKNLDLFAVMVWTTWYRRNLLRTSSKPFSINQVRINVVATYEEFIRDQPRMAPVSS